MCRYRRDVRAAVERDARGPDHSRVKGASLLSKRSTSRHPASALAVEEAPMDSLIAAAARALAAGDAIGALKCVSLRDDPPALAMRGIAMAQLGEYPRARELLRRAGRHFGPREALARARCVVAEAEVRLAMRDLGGSTRSLASAAATLEARG